MQYVSAPWSFIRRHRWTVLFTSIALLPIVGIAVYAFTPRAPSYVTEQAIRGDLRQTVEAVGTVISERDLQLQFPVSGIVARVDVREGDTVRAGQRLLSLRAGNLAADIAATSARVQAAEAELRAREEGSRVEDIAIAQAEVQSRRASLEAAGTVLRNSQETLAQSEAKILILQREVDTALAGQVSTAGGTVQREASAALSAIASIRSTMQVNEITDAVIRTNNAEYQFLLTDLTRAQSQLSVAMQASVAQSYSDAVTLLQNAQTALSVSAQAANRAHALIHSLSQTAYLTDALRETYRAAVATDRGILQTSLTTLDTALRSLRDAAASYETRIAAEEASVIASRGAMDRAQSDIATYEAALRIAQAQLDLRRAPARQTDIDAARANVRQARASLQRAQADYANTVLNAPIAGRVTKINAKVGESVAGSPVVTLLGESPFRIEMFVSEIDIPKVRYTQSGSVMLDAFGDTQFALRVTDIDIAPTDRDGVNKYRVRLDFVYRHDELKIGMTGDAEIVTGGVTDVVAVPVRAVLERDDGETYVRILQEDGTVEERVIDVGLEGEAGLVEVSNVEEGETIIVLERT